MENQIKNGNPFWLLLAIPVFFLVWKLIGLGYAFIVGLGALAILYVIFVWLPDDQARKLTRKLKFEETRKVLNKVTLEVAKIKDRTLKYELGEKALKTFTGLVDDLSAESRHQGLVEEKVLPSISNLDLLVTKWINHETNRNPLSENEASKLRATLMAMDDLYAKWRKDGVDDLDERTAENETESDIQSAGIDTERGKK